MLLYQESKLLELNLTGNPITNVGIIPIFCGLAVAKSMQKIYLGAQLWNDKNEMSVEDE
jgi:hypothetical protein